MVEEAELVEKLREILQTADLTMTTNAIVRQKLEEHFGVDLSDKKHKKFVSDQINVFLREQQKREDADEKGDENDEEGDGETAKEEQIEKTNVKGKAGGLAKLCILSPQLQNILGESKLSRGQVCKRIWAYIYEHDLQDPIDKRKIMCDDKLFELLEVKTVDMFQMNKALSRHIWPLDSQTEAPTEPSEMEEQPKAEEREEPAFKSNVIKNQPIKERAERPTEPNEMEEQPKGEEQEGKLKQKMQQLGVESEEEVDSPRKDKRQKTAGSRTFAPFTLSDALVKFLGTGESALPRSEVVRRIWVYIKENNLQDPSDKRRILCDNKLKELFPTESFNGFSMPGLLKPHFINPED